MGIVASCLDVQNRPQEMEAKTAPRQPDFDVVYFPSYYSRNSDQKEESSTEEQTTRPYSDSVLTMSVHELAKKQKAATLYFLGDLSVSASASSIKLVHQNPHDSKSSSPISIAGDDNLAPVHKVLTNDGEKDKTS